MASHEDMLISWEAILSAEVSPMKQKYVPLEKRSKRQQKEFHDSQRKTWGGLNPITRKTANHKAYNRKKSERWHEYDHRSDFLYIANPLTKPTNHIDYIAFVFPKEIK